MNTYKADMPRIKQTKPIMMQLNILTGERKECETQSKDYIVALIAANRLNVDANTYGCVYYVLPATLDMIVP